MATRQRKAKTVADTDTGTVRFDFASGGHFVAHADKLPQEIVNQLVLHGLKQKLADAYADPDADPREAVMEVYNDLLAGTWFTRGEGGPRLTQLAKAVFAAYAQEPGKPAWMENEETIQAHLDTLYLVGEGEHVSFRNEMPNEDGTVEWEDDGKAHKAALSMLRKSGRVKAQLDRMALEAAKARADKSAKDAETGPSLF